MKSKYQFNYYTRIVINVLIYIIFFYFIINNIITAKDNNTRLFNIIILVFFGLVALIYEILRTSYDVATKRLIFDDKPEDTLKILDKISKFDFVKEFKTSIQMMRMLALIDLRRFDELKEFINQLNEKEIKDYDVKLISEYALMIADGETDKKGSSNEAYKRLIALKDQTTKTGRKRKGSYYLNWSVVDGLHKNYEGDYKSAYQFLKDIDETNLNRREVVQYLLAKLLASKKINETKVYEETKDRLNKLVTNNQATLNYINEI